MIQPERLNVFPLIVNSGGISPSFTKPSVICTKNIQISFILNIALECKIFVVN